MKEIYTAPVLFEIQLIASSLRTDKIINPQALQNFKNYKFDETNQTVSFELKENTTSVEYAFDEVDNYLYSPIYTSVDLQIPLFCKYFYESNSKLFKESDFKQFLIPLDPDLKKYLANKILNPENTNPTSSDIKYEDYLIPAIIGVALLLYLSKSKKRKK